MTDLRPRNRYLLTLLGVFLLVLIASAIKPWHPSDYLLENALVVPAIAVLIFTRNKLPLSKLSYTLIFAFLCLHELGAHYTYSEVPYDAWFESLFGTTLNEMLGFERNHFDRLVHFAYGLLFAYPIRELVLRIGGMKGFWGYFLPLDVTMSTSLIYELVEWAAAESFGGELGMAYLGTQGDVWDAHKDMTLAALGALIAMGVTAFVNWRLQHDFAREWAESLRVKGKKPLGEEAIARMKRGRS
jgi:putative membrane protein